MQTKGSYRRENKHDVRIPPPWTLHETVPNSAERIVPFSFPIKPCAACRISFPPDKGVGFFFFLGRKNCSPSPSSNLRTATPLQARHEGDRKLNSSPTTTVSISDSKTLGPIFPPAALGNIRAGRCIKQTWINWYALPVPIDVCAACQPATKKARCAIPTKNTIGTHCNGGFSQNKWYPEGRGVRASKIRNILKKTEKITSSHSGTGWFAASEKHVVSVYPFC